MGGQLYWKDLGGILLRFFLLEEVEEVIREFHSGDCGGHLYWKVTANKILREGLYWPNIFPDVHKKFKAFHECHIFEGKRKLSPLPLKPISVNAPFR